MFSRPFEIQFVHCVVLWFFFCSPTFMRTSQLFPFQSSGSSSGNFFIHDFCTSRFRFFRFAGTYRKCMLYWNVDRLHAWRIAVVYVCVCVFCLFVVRSAYWLRLEARSSIRYLIPSLFLSLFVWIDCEYCRTNTCKREKDIKM